jgi:hypothetical protein
MTTTAGGNGLKPAVQAAFDAFSRARQAISRVFVPALDLYADGCATVEGVSVNNGGVPTSGSQVSFICDGYLVAITASVETGSAVDLSCLKMAVAVDGQTQLFLSGQNGTGYVSFAQLVGSGGYERRIMAPIKQIVPWQVFFKNVGSTSAVVVDVSFWYVNRSSPPLTT